jgi:hypothetical protein
MKYGREMKERMEEDKNGEEEGKERMAKGKDGIKDGKERMEEKN